MAALRSHIDALNSHCASSAFSQIKLDEDTVSIQVKAEGCKGTVNISLHERSSYPRTGGLAFADGSDQLVAAVESVSEAIGEKASLDHVLRLLSSKLTCKATEALVASLPAPTGSAPVPAAHDDDDDDDDDNDDDDPMDEDGADDDDDDDDAQSCSNLDYDFERGAELENSLLRLRHQWELKDQKRRGDLGEPVAPEEPPPAAKPQPSGGKSKKEAARQQKRGAHQIFSSAEATRMLCNELFDMMKEEAEGFGGVSAQCVDLDIHLWRVQVRDLDPTSQLHQDMQQLKAKFGSDALELELQFTPDMHPFYPAWVKVLRPRFQDVAAEAAMSHPVMTLEGWDPMKPVKGLIRFVQSFLERHGRVALDDERNDPAKHPEGAYTGAEHCLCRLEILTAVKPHWASTHAALYAARAADVDLDRIRTLNFGAKKKASTATAGKGGWAAGVGYGHGATDGVTWDITATEKAQAQQDREMRSLLAQLVGSVDAGQLRPDVLEHSCARTLLWQQLANGSLLDIGSRPERTSMYSNMLALIGALARQPALKDVLARPCQAQSDGQAGSGRSIFEALEAVRRQAEFFVGKASRESTAAASSSIDLTSALASDAASDGDTLALALRILECARTVGASPAATARTPHSAPTTPAASSAASAAAATTGTPSSRTRSTRASASKESAAAGKQAAAAAAASAEEDYVRQIRELQFSAEEALPGHHYEAREGGKEAGGLQLPARTKRLALEAADMMGGALPAAASSTIWVRLDEQRIHLWRAMISGPEDTPYSGGLFIFEILCPAEYPTVAPKVNLQTTGGGSVRFNPNLYHCGKVCLSLLGTWQGDQGEQWHAQTSTLLQVLMSIQALILVPDPYFNEPGYERERNTPSGDRQSRAYNEAIREGTIKYAMVEQMRKPPPELREAVHLHFRLRKDALLKEVHGWRDDPHNSSPHTTKLKALCTELEAEFAKLPSQ